MKAIDMHVHIPRQPGLEKSDMEQTLRNYFKLGESVEDVENMAKRYESMDMMGVLVSINSETSTGEKGDSNDYISEIVTSYPGRFIGFAAIDPWQGKASVEELERAVKDLSLRGLKLHPVQQAFHPNDEKFYPLYEKAMELNIPVLFHSGMAASGSGMAGGGGMKLKYSAPIPGMDDVAADFPHLTVIMAHPGWPWIEEQIAVALHKPNVYLDLSGWLPRYIPKQLLDEANTRLQDKVLFGSDYPFITPDKWLKDWEQIPIKDEIQPKILLENAKKALHLDNT
jgi:predicted TIM-barrel fold metal-dependent hydrolase|tara:strand:+ start:1215 stop:2063 length:849 start_codon:yes stop_codon:yes gene_type:complete